MFNHSSRFLSFFSIIGVFFLFSAHDVFASSVTINASIASVCNNNVLDDGEECDNSQVGGQTCISRGFSGGTLGCSASCTFDTSQCTSGGSGGGGGGGGGGGIFIPPPQVVFKGLAYPGSKVTVLRDGQIAATTIAGPDAKFEVGLYGLLTASYNFGIFAVDNEGRRPITHTYLLDISPLAVSVISGIFFPPTISVDKSEVKKGDILNILGQTIPRADVSVMVNSSETIIKKVSADAGGGWFYKLDTSPLEYGEHSAQARAETESDISQFSGINLFRVGFVNKTIQKLPPLKGDINGDGNVNLIDFSVAAYWYKRPSPPANVDLNGDSVVNLVDFSIMAYYWTG